MSSKRYPEEFKIEAVKQITERGHPVAEEAGRIGISEHSLYAWVKQYRLLAEIRRLKAELKRITEEHDILKRLQRSLARSLGKVLLHQERRRAAFRTATLPDGEGPSPPPSIWPHNANPLGLATSAP